MVRTSLKEPKMISFLIRNFLERLSINQLAKKVSMTPKGAHKLLKRLEQEGIVKPQKMGNAVFYSLNFSSDFARKKAELSLFEQPRLPYARVQAKDLERIKPFALSAILFGSVLRGEGAKDIDVLVIVKEDSYKGFSKALNELQRLKSKRIQAVLQNPDDFIKNLKKQDSVVLNAVKTGNILWGHEIIVNSICEALK